MLAIFGVGQMIDENFDFEQITDYANEIDIDEKELLNVVKTVVPISNASFTASLNFVSILAETISDLAEEKLKQIQNNSKNKQTHENSEKASYQLLEKGDNNHLVMDSFSQDTTEQHLMSVNQQLDANNQQLIATEQQLLAANRQLTERVKELNCFYDISKIVEIPGISLEEILQRTVEIIPASWQYSEITACRIIIDNIEYRTQNFRKTNWSQSSNIIIDGKSIGIIEVCYLKEVSSSGVSPFLKEERMLIDAIAERFGRIIQRRKIMGVVQESEERFRTFFEQGIIGMCITTIKGSWVEINSVICDYLGYSRDELLKLTWVELTHPDDVEKDLFELNRVIDGEIDDYVLEKRFIRKDGSVIYTEISVNGIRNAKDNTVDYFLSLMQDITDRKRTENALHESEKKFRSYIENAPDGVFIVNEKGEYKDVNEAACRITGYKKEELLELSIPKLIHPEYLEKASNHFQNIIKDGYAKTDLAYVKKLGEKRYWSIDAVKLSNNRFLGFAKDITDRKNADEEIKSANQQLIANEQQLVAANHQLVSNNQQLVANEQELLHEKAFSDTVTAKLEKSELKYRNQANFLDSVIEKSPFAMWASDAKGTIIRINQTLRDTLDVTDDLVVGNYNILTDENINKQGFSSEVKSVFTELKTVRFTLYWEGSEVGASDLSITKKLWLDASFFPITDETGKLTNVICQYVDITKRKNAEEEIKSANQQLKTFNQQLSAKEQQLGAANQQLISNEQQLVAANQQLESNNQQLVANEQELIREKELSETVTAKLQKSEIQYRNQASFLNNVINNSPFAMWISDAEGTMIKANQSLFSILDISEDMIIGLYNVLNDENIHKQGFSSEIKSVFNELKTVRLTMYWEGSEIGDSNLSITKKLWLDASLFPITDETGKLTNVICQYVDITKRKNAEDALIESDEKFRYVLSNSVTTIYNLNLKTGTYDYLSPAVEDMYGFPAEEFISGGLESAISRFHPDDYKKIEDHLEGLLSKKVKDFKSTVEYRFDHPKRGYRWISDTRTVIFDENGEPKSLIGNSSDITDRKNAEEDLIKLSAAVQQSPAIIVMTNLEGVIEYVNPKFSEVTGYSMAEIENKNIDILKSERVTNEVLEDLWDIISSGGVWSGDYQNKRKDGSLFWERASISPIRNDQNQIINYIKVAEDITEVKRKEQELKAALEKAKESDRLKSAFLSNMSHEIRTPMNGILGFTELLKEPQLTGDEKGKYIKIIEKSGNRMLTTINDIIDIAKIESGQVEVLHSETSINELLAELHEFFILEAKTKGIQLVCQSSISDHEANILTDKHKLEGVLTNLIKNSLKFTDSGIVTFGYNLVKNNNGVFELEFFVSDTGIGIPKDRQKAIFNRFEQADIEDKDVYEGSGLGLTISRSYIEMLGGKIWVTSEEGVGSIFKFVIPFNKENRIEKIIHNDSISENEPQNILKNISIIVAEDDEVSVLLFENIFKNIFKEIIFTTTGNETIEKCRENPEIDIVLMDIRMPNTNGYEATREIRKFNEDILIIAQTAFSITGDREKAIESGCNDYITKPLDKNLLLEKLIFHVKNSVG